MAELAIDSRTDSITALLSVAALRPLAVDTACRLAPVTRALSAGEPATAAIALSQSGLPGLANVEAAEALALAVNALNEGVAPDTLLKWAALTPLNKYDPNQPRDDQGRWSAARTPLAGDVINICTAHQIVGYSDDFGNKFYDVTYECRDGSHDSSEWIVPQLSRVHPRPKRLIDNTGLRR